jgi:hypothetical protein
VSEASDLIGATGHPAVPVTLDVSDPSSIEAAHDADSGLGGFHADVASTKSFYSDVLGSLIVPVQEHLLRSARQSAKHPGEKLGLERVP